jgi:hypothetical protein
VAEILLFLVASPAFGANRHAVQASREGLIGKRTATGMIIQPKSHFVALPSRAALGRVVVVTYGRVSVTARVHDVGPHATNDPYWARNRHPAIERRKRGNRAGIDLSDATWDALGIPRHLGIVPVTWFFRN